MSGWARLWVVFSLVMGGLLAMSTMNANKVDANPFYYDQSIPKAAADAQFWKNARADVRLKDCDWPTAQTIENYGGMGSSVEYTITCDRTDRYTSAFWYFLFPGAFFGGIGLTIGWIVRGFRGLAK